MALSMALTAVFTFIPSPIFFGYLIERVSGGVIPADSVLHRPVYLDIRLFADKACLVWGKSCTGSGNCWIYDSGAMRKLLNFTAAGE
ncbi:hypothetical protein PR048_019166 [Dryococelus australis]|uniref:Uncharacterized protein n=1 Tax=Dryococelus australis TaxID=614101 RepID=A0ABQ9H2T4_9NEOP|nr:hypothetical protein PR048_019166 [Dryococelus australis]